MPRTGPGNLYLHATCCSITLANDLIETDPFMVPGPIFNWFI